MSHDQSIGVVLDQLLPSATRTGSAGMAVTSCTSDWRRVRPGDAFVAVLSDDDDGHDDVTQAVERGAVAVIAERPVPVFSVPVYLVEDSRVALGELCHALAGHPSQQLRVIGVVGTQGKSTVIALLESIYAAAGCEVGVLSSLKSYDGMTSGPGLAEATSPAALAARLARMEAAGCTHALIEISSQALCQGKLAGIELDTVCGTTVDSARLDLHHTTKNYRDAQRRVLEYLSPAGLAVLNADDPVSCRWLSEIDAPSLTYGLGDQAQITAEVVERSPGETVFILTAGCESAAVRTAVIGDHHVSNCLAAATTALAHGIDLQTIAAGIEAVQKIPARMERIDCGQDFPVFVDAAHNAPALRATLLTARQLAVGRVICVLGDSLPRNSAEADVTRGVVRRLSDVAIVTESLTSLDSAWLDDSDSDSESKLQVAVDRGEAIAWAVSLAEQGDVVVIAGSRGHGECGFGAVDVTDADAARELLYACNGPALRLVA